MATATISDQITKMRQGFFGDSFKRREETLRKLEEIDAEIEGKEKEFAKAMKDAGFVPADTAPTNGRKSSSKKSSLSAAEKKAKDEKQRQILAGILGDNNELSIQELYDLAKDKFPQEGIPLQGFSLPTLKAKLNDKRFKVEGDRVSLA